MNLILDLLFPKKCVGCKKIGEYFCSNCASSILQTDLVCPNCEKLAVGGQTHPLCHRKFGLEGLWSLGIYSDSLKKAIQQLKYKYVNELAEVLIDITLEYWAKYQPFIFDNIKKDSGEGWIVTAVPLHWFRENNRGYNQSDLLAKLLADKLGLKYLQALKRVKYTKSQVKLKGRERFQNIKNAFEISPEYELKTMNSVLLIDDVWTTGSTIKECCYILKRAGAKKVWALTIAR